MEFVCLAFLGSGPSKNWDIRVSELMPMAAILTLHNLGSGLPQHRQSQHLLMSLWWSPIVWCFCLFGAIVFGIFHVVFIDTQAHNCCEVRRESAIFNVRSSPPMCSMFILWHILQKIFSAQPLKTKVHTVRF